MHTCEFCTRSFDRPSSLATHAPYCVGNPLRVQRVRSPNAGRRKGCTAWNKGLTKESDSRIKEHSEKLAKTMKDAWNDGRRVFTEEQKNQFSKAAKDKKLGGYNPRGGRGKKGWYKGIWCDSSWELAWVIYALDNNIKFTKNSEKFAYTYEDKSYSYIPDFLLDDGTYIEIKGYETDRVKAKIECFPHKIQLITKVEIDAYIKYATDKFGKDFVKLYANGELPELV